MNTPIVLNPTYEYRINTTRTSVFLFYDDGHEFKAITNDLVVDVIDALEKSRHTAKTLGVALADKYTYEEILEVIEQLEQDGFIVGLAREIHPDLVEQWSTVENTPVMLQEALKRTKVAVESFGVDASSFIERLDSIGVQCSPVDEADFAVVLTGEVLAPELEAFNEHAMQAELPWIMARGVGQKLWFTAFIPQETPCWYCFAQAIRRNRAGMLWFDTEEHQLYRASQPHVKDRILTPMAAAHLENLVLHRIFNGDFSEAKGHLFLIDTRSGEVDAPRRYVFSASCPYCSQANSASADTLLPLQPRKKKFTLDGGHRTSDPATAFKAYEHLIDPYVGFFRNLQRIDTGENDLVHIFMMQYCRTTPFTDSKELLRTDTGYSYGKGISEWQTKASCLFEAIERYSGQWRSGIPVVTSTYENMEHRVVHPHDLLLFSEQQYQNRATWNKTCPDKFTVFEPFDDKAYIEWVATHSLTTGETVYIPAACGFYGYRAPGSSFAFADSNGCSAGLTPEEAILQGLFEVVERDALALAFGHKASFTRVDLSGVSLPYFDQIKGYLASRRRSLAIYRVPSQFAIPCYIAVSESLEGEKPLLTGYGCHLDPVIAVSRAVTELGQSLHTEIDESLKQASQDPFRVNKYDQLACLTTSAPKKHEILINIENKTTDDVTEDLRICIGMLQEKGLEVLVLDQTDPEVGCPVVKVIVPGMYHFWFRKGGKRISDVPAHENWRYGALSEEEFEPVWFTV